jgi:hypothetical protein
MIFHGAETRCGELAGTAPRNLIENAGTNDVE